MTPGVRDVAQIRLDNAMLLFEEFVQATVKHPDAATLRGLERRFAERLQIQPSYWSQIKGRSRQIGERLARQFEVLCQRGGRWQTDAYFPDDKAAASRAEALLAALKQGESFDELALRFSDGPNASRGGRLGLVRQGELLPAIEQAVAGLPVGGITGIVETPEGFHLVRVDDKSERQFRPFDQVKQEIQSLVFQQKTEDQYQTWMADLKNKAFIEIKI